MSASIIRPLVWTCTVCGHPIADGEGGLEVQYGDLHRSAKDGADWEAGHKGGYTLDELLAAPAAVQWQIAHWSCSNLEDTYSIAVNRLRTHAALLAWTAHLMEKPWIGLTDWSEVIAAVAGSPAL